MKKQEIIDYMVKNKLNEIKLKTKEDTSFYSYGFRNIYEIVDDNKEYLLKEKIDILSRDYGKEWYIELSSSDKDITKKIEHFVLFILEQMDGEISSRKKEYDKILSDIESVKKTFETVKDELQYLYKEKNDISQTISNLFNESIILKKDIEIKKAKLFKNEQ